MKFSCDLIVYFYLTAILYMVQAQCPDGFEPHGNSCYKAPNLEASWAEAQMYCQILGSDLAIVDSAAEEAVVEGMLARLHGGVDDTYWIAGTDIVTEANWMWTSRAGVSSPITGYSNWPSGVVPSDSRNHNCLAIHYRNGRSSWTDAYCNTLHSFVCEVKLVVQTTTTESAIVETSAVTF